MNYRVFIQEPGGKDAIVRCKNVDECLDVVAAELGDGKKVGTRITMVRKRPREAAQPIVMWKVGRRGTRRYNVEHWVSA